MLKSLPIILSQNSQNFDPLFLYHHLLFLLILVIFIVSMIIMSSKDHDTHGNCYIGQPDVVSADFSSEFT